MQPLLPYPVQYILFNWPFCRISLRASSNPSIMAVVSPEFSESV